MSSYYGKFNVTIGIVADVFLYESMESAANFVYVSPFDDLSSAKFDMFLVVSAWRGCRNNEWTGLGKANSPQRKILYGFIDVCKRLGIPVVFYSKEDPPNYRIFVEIAKKCDAVFTSAVEMVAKYIADCGHNRVWALPFCINPETQNPLSESDVKGHGVVFSGSWMDKYPQRCKDLRLLFDGVLRSGVGFTIYNRNSNLAVNADRYRLPAKYLPFVKPAVEHREVLEIHKAYPWAINVNTVTRSATMFAVRCYELSACGVCLLSNYSYGLHELLPEVCTVFSSRDVTHALKYAGKSYLGFRSACAIRAVMTGKTCYDVVGFILEKMGLGAMPPARTVAVVVPCITEEVNEAFDAQTYSAKELFEASRFGAGDVARFDFVAIWNAPPPRNPFLLEDALNVFKWGNFDAVSSGGQRILTRARYVSGSTPEHEMSATEFHLPDPPEAYRKPVLTVCINVGADYRRLLACSFSSLFLCRCFSNVEIVLDNVQGCTAMAVARMLCSTYRNIRIGEEAEGTGSGGMMPVLRMSAGDEVVPAVFDHAVRKMSWFWSRGVVADALVCGRVKKRVPGAVRLLTGALGIVLHIRTPLLILYDRNFGICESSHVWVKWQRKSLLSRLEKCYRDNGMFFTIRRCLFGKRERRGSAE